MRSRPFTPGIAALAVMSLLMACGRSAGPTPPGPPATPAPSTGPAATLPGGSFPAERLTRAQQSRGLVRISEMTEAEKRYGIAPLPHPEVTYQPEVVMVGGGAEAIREMKSNGLQWTIDARAPRASEVAPGKIMFVTSRAVGRVLAVDAQPDGNLLVTLGPADISDIIRDCNLTISTSVDFSQALRYEVTDYPGAANLAEAPSPGPQAWMGSGSIQHASWTMAEQAPPAAGEITVDQFTVTPSVGSDGFGLNFKTRQNGLAIDASAKLYVRNPKVDFVLNMKDGKKLTAELVISGAAGLRMEFVSATDVGRTANINKLVYVPVDFSIPFFEAGIPLSVSVNHLFLINTVFSAKGQIRAVGDYGFDGKFSAGWREGQFGVGGPGGLHVRESLLQSINGVSLGAAGLNMGHAVRVMAGVGVLGFAAGPYVGLNSTVAVKRHSDLDTLARCRAAALLMDLDAGVGYRMPNAVVSVINFFLRHLKKPEIVGMGGVQAARKRLVEATSYHPQLKICSEA